MPMIEAIDLVPEREDDFAVWVRPHLSSMARLASRLAASADRDDIVQEALERAWLKRRQFDPRRGSAAGWLLAITADQARKAARRSRRVAGPSEPYVPTTDVERTVDIEQAMALLPRRQRLAIDCFYFADLSIAETAAVMKCAEGTVKSTLADARARLRSQLEVLCASRTTVTRSTSCCGPPGNPGAQRSRLRPPWISAGRERRRHLRDGFP